VYSQLEAGLHYNWHRHYDPSLGRYTQPDPLGFVARLADQELQATRRRLAR
jgi:RHS repeat-associated protein